MHANPLLRRVLGETDVTGQHEVPQRPEAEAAVPPTPTTPAAPANDGKATATASVQQLAALWNSGEHMGVAAKLMFTPASYVDFVDLVFIIGHGGGRELGQLLDELADTESMEPPPAPPEYRSILQKASGTPDDETI